MEYNGSKWLKDELGLPQLSEAHLYNILYHPRHGNLCRRLTQFLAESTLCGESHPDVLAKDESLEADRELEEKKEEVDLVYKGLRDYIKENENLERELIFLRSRFDHLQDLEDLVKTSTKALTEICGRPNAAIDQVPQNLEIVDHLLEDISSTLYSKTSDSKAMFTRKTAKSSNGTSMDEELDDLVRKVNLMHSAIAKAYRSAVDKKNRSEYKLEPIKVLPTELTALKTPKVDEIKIDLNPEEKELKKENMRLVEEIHELDVHVSTIQEEYKTKINEHYRSQKGRLKRYLSSLNELDDLIAITKSD